MVDQLSAVNPLLFTKTLEFAGVFRDGDLATKPLSVEIRYSLLNAHPPLGIIRGTAADWDELESFFHRRPSSMCELESVSVAEGREKIRSKQVLLREISMRHYPDDESKTIQQVLGRFEPWDVTIDQDYGGLGKRSREMTFFLTGPTIIWMSHAIRTFSYTGNTKTKFPRVRLWDSRMIDVRVTVHPYFLYPSRFEKERRLEPREARWTRHHSVRLSVEAETFALTVTDRDLNRTDEAFEARALAIADILLLLASFLSKATVTWYARTLWSDGRLCDSYRDVPEVPSSRLRWEHVVLYPKHVRRFMSRAFTAYDERADKGVNLRLPILLYVAAQSAPTVDEQFILLFLCLEKVVDMLDQNDRWEVLTQKELNTMVKCLRTQLREMGKDAQTVTVVNEKITELQRPAFWRRVFRHLKRLKIDLDDIGGYDALRDTIKIRNSLIHRAEEVHIARIVQEQKRLQTVAARVLLTLLDWRRGPTNTPTLANRLAPSE